MNPDQLLVVAGEVSGDIHGAHLLEALRRLRPGLTAFGMGGSQLRGAGLDVLVDSSEISVVGLVEALKVLGRARRAFRTLLDEVARRRPAVAVLIDSPDFNLRRARRLHGAGVAVIYYVSPQVWAWRSGRVRLIDRWVDRMLVLFGFERDWYAERGIDALHVGHPLVDQIPELPQAWDGEDGEPSPLIVSLLPGSRRSEVERLLAPMLEAAGRLEERFRIELRLIKAPDLPDDLFEECLGGRVGAVRVVTSDRSRAIAASHLALCASGTATLEVGLLGTPMVVVYKVKRWSHRLGRLVIRVPYISLVNLVLGRAVVPELIQDDASPEAIAAAASHLLGDREARDAQRAELARLRVELGEPGASERAAAEIVTFLEARA
jgi:lipid-A-disaccharide synthase